MTTLTISNAQIWALLQGRGYTIEITNKGDSQHAEFHGKYAINTCKGGEFSSEFSRQEIIYDCLPRLLNWAGLQPKIFLDYI